MGLTISTNFSFPISITLIQLTSELKAISRSGEGAAKMEIPWTYNYFRWSTALCLAAAIRIPDWNPKSYMNENDQGLFLNEKMEINWWLVSA